MLGDRRSNSLFTDRASATAPGAKPEQAEVHNISFEESTGRAIFAESKVAPKASDVFFAPKEKGMPFTEVLEQVQSFLSGSYAGLIIDDSEDAKAQMKRRIARFLQEKRMAVDGMTQDELVDALYTEMAEYGFLTKYIFADGIEEIDVNSWRDIEIQYSDGRTAKLDEHFDSPEHAANVIRRMLQNSGKVLDNASPIITSRLARNIRVSVIKTPVLDEDAGVAASIRIVNPRNLTKEDFVKSGTATDEMLDFLSACLRYGVSICVAGATSSGKTTVAGWLLSTIPDRKRIFTIEDGSRELQLVRERDGKVVNSVVHTQTRDSENERQRIDQIALLDIALRFNPDIICVGEMRGPEANAAQEAARVGIAVLTTIHSNSSEGTYRRMVSLCKRAVDTPDDTLMGYVTEAYPIVVYCRQLENKERRITNISECEILPDGTRKLHKLYEYEITENRLEDDRFIIEGQHRRCEEMSGSLQRRFIENGMPRSELEAFLQRKEVTA
ncbi:MAG: type II/IV secretion system ATPase subunit [Candidatus Ventricola sp.]